MTERVQVRVVLVFGAGPDARAELETPWHTPQEPLAMRAADIAQQASLPVNELPGRRFWATFTAAGPVDFELVDDPRQ
jgi:hypothetical protein